MTAISTPRRTRQNTLPQNSVLPDTQTTLSDAPLRPAQASNRQSGSTLRKKRAPYYPTGDGKPMAEDVLHRKLMAYCCDALEFYFAARPDVLVAGNDFVYYEEGNPKARVSPDCYVVMGIEPKGVRHFYKLWEDNGIAPCVVIELTSRKTQKEDVSVKRPLYEQVLRVAEYFQFDPTGDYLSPRLQGQRLVNGVYQPIELRDDRMTSEQLGLELVVEGETLRLYDPASGKFLPTYAQAEAQRLQEMQRAEQETKRAESEAQRAQQEAQRAQQEAQRAQAADERAQAADRRAEGEAQRAETAEAELNRLRGELDMLRQQK